MDKAAVEPWLEAGRDDLRQIENNLAGPKPTMRGAAYHCQQAAEKLAKAVLVSEAIAPPRWHDIGQLVDLLPPSHPLVAALSVLERSTPYLTAFRYPGDETQAAAPVEPTPAEVTTWLAELKATHRSAEQFLGLSPPVVL